MSARFILKPAQLRKALSPQTYKTSCAADYWVQCCRAAIAAVKVCCRLSNPEISFFRRENWLEDQAIVRVQDDNPVYNRDIPMIDAARVVVKRYMDAMPFKDSRYLFVTAKGKRFDVPSLRQTMNLAGERAGLCEELMGDLENIFSRAVHADPVRDGAALVLTCKGLAAHGLDDKARPGLERLRQCLKGHPLAGHGDISYFEVGEPTSRLLKRIRACTETRVLTEDQQETLRVTEFPEAFKLHAQRLITHVLMARYFGLKVRQLRFWCERYRSHGEAALQGRRTGCLTPEWRTRVMELCDGRPPTETRSEFHAFLVETHQFPYDKETLCVFLRSFGYRQNYSARLSVNYGDLIEKEYANCKEPPRLSEFHRQLVSKGFPFAASPLMRFMNRQGLALKPLDHGHEWRSRVADVARATRPPTYKALHGAMVKRGYPCTRLTMSKHLRAVGIELSGRAPGGRRFDSAARHRPPVPDPGSCTVRDDRGA